MKYAPALLALTLGLASMASGATPNDSYRIRKVALNNPGQAQSAAMHERNALRKASRGPRIDDDCDGPVGHFILRMPSFERQAELLWPEAKKAIANPELEGFSALIGAPPRTECEMNVTGK